MSTPISGWDRVAMAIEEVQARLIRSAAVLDAANIPYAVVGGNAVAEWVGRIDKGAIRFTKNVDILLRRDDLPKTIEVMAKAGFQFSEALGVPFFLDGPNASPRDAVHIVYSAEKVKEHDSEFTPDISETERAEKFSVVSLEGLVRMKLQAFRRKDQVHLIDMLEVGLIDATWLDKLPPQFATRLKELIDNPE
jgi:hypothetical protein